ncbi:2-polyprenyl-6-methoxyphenol hydroxylase-like FAD-dependent oxidoreductase [Propionibacteriaceae bacterium ES.041]|uniref:FAD-dependent monooxygenase n=1 Tax=Enemella evansiae TaxID=2016499 RepID=UPI000B9740A9|nr:FAD-dependent monooxygenase [Enemella evansiae]OYN98474.1 FAD-binding monooxygenase [Enemella evansiae]PFG65345.1 2-polyprenyl-6-methoxyphenol hydroxylase-like FAD-dependent oxidoreductase [Propionibacteriaceae bacterium ES.041]
MVTTIDIIGGGVAGLALAARLDPHRFRIRVLDAGRDAREVGTCFGIWPFAMPSLAALGLAERVRAAGVRPTAGSIWNAAGRRLVHSARVPEVWLVTRVQLLDWLDQAVGPHVERVGTRVADPGTSEAELVIGADGAYSITRERIFGRGATSTGIVALRGLVPFPVEPGEYWGRGAHFGSTPHPDGLTNWFATLPEFRAGPVEALDRARAAFADFPAPVRAVLAAATPEQTLVNRIVEAPSLPSFVHGRTVLIGDAAHAMSPNLGRGACESLVDAAVLAEALGSAPPAEALARYDRVRRRPTQRIRRLAAAMRRLSLGGGPLRDPLLRTVGTLVR